MNRVEFNCHIDMDNAAFDDDPSWELSRLLKSVGYCVAIGQTEGVCMDITGSEVGKWAIESTE